MRYAHVIDGVVVNVVEADNKDALKPEKLVHSDTADIGDLWLGGATFTTPPMPTNDQQGGV